MLRFLVGAALAAALTVATVAAAPKGGGQASDALSFTLQFGVYGHHVVNPVDHLTWCGDCWETDYTTGSPWVVNPRTSWPYNLPAGPEPGEPGCMWDSDDYYSYVSQGSGTLAAGASVTLTECRYSSGEEYPAFLTNISIEAPTPNLLVTETWASDTTSVTATIVPTNSGNMWLYFGCVRSPAVVGTMVAIPDSNGASAIPQTITLRVHNPTSRKVSRIGGVIESGGPNGQSRGCTSWAYP